MVFYNNRLDINEVPIILTVKPSEIKTFYHHL